MRRTVNGYLNTYELDEWYQRMEDKAFDDIANDDDLDSDNEDGAIQ